MENDMNGNKLPLGLVELDRLEVLVIVDNETDTLSSVDEGIPQIPEMIHRTAIIPPTRIFDGRECKVILDQLCCACHGYSVLISGQVGERIHTALFDVGPYPDIWIDNARRLNVDLSIIETIFLSHWHRDHSGGFPEVIEAVSNARKVKGLPPPTVNLHPKRPDQRGILLPTGIIVMLDAEPTLEDMKQAGGEIVTYDTPHSICGGFFFGSGEIERKTEYETGLAGHHSFYGDEGVLDPLILDERYIGAVVKGRGISVFSSCSHAGIVNVCLDAQTNFPEVPIDMVTGGYHLSGKKMETKIDETIADLKEIINPRLIAPGHCTGLRGKARLMDAFSPGRFAPSVVGTKYRLEKSPH